MRSCNANVELARKSLLWAREAWLTFDSTGKSSLCPNPLGPDSPAQMAWAVLPSQPVKTGRQTLAGEGQEGPTARRSLKVGAQKDCFPSSRNYPVRPLQVHTGSRPKAMNITFFCCPKKGIQGLISVKIPNTWATSDSKNMPSFHLRFWAPNCPRNENVSTLNAHGELLKSACPAIP